MLSLQHCRGQSTVRAFRRKAENLVREVLISFGSFPQGYCRFESLVHELIRVETEGGSVASVLAKFRVLPGNSRLVPILEIALGLNDTESGK